MYLAHAAREVPANVDLAGVAVKCNETDGSPQILVGLFFADETDLGFGIAPG